MGDPALLLSSTRMTEASRAQSRNPDVYQHDGVMSCGYEIGRWDVAYDGDSEAASIGTVIN